MLERLAFDAVDLFNDDFRAPEAELKALAAHILSQNRDLKLTATAYFKFTLARVFIAHRDVGFHLRFQALVDLI